MLLDQKTCLIAGGAGEVGEGIVRSFLKEGATVIVPSRSPYKLHALRERLEPTHLNRLMTLVGNIGSIEGAMEIRKTIEEEFDSLDVVVASLGGTWQGAPILEISLDTWHQLIDNNMTSHFITAKLFMPMLIKAMEGSYLFIAAPAGENPMVNSGPLSVTVAGQMMLHKVLVEELSHSNVRINTLIPCTPVVTRSRVCLDKSWLTSDDVGDYAAFLCSDNAHKIKDLIIRFEDRRQLPSCDIPASYI